MLAGWGRMVAAGSAPTPAQAGRSTLRDCGSRLQRAAGRGTGAGRQRRRRGASPPPACVWLLALGRQPCACSGTARAPLVLPPGGPVAGSPGGAQSSRPRCGERCLPPSRLCNYAIWLATQNAPPPSACLCRSAWHRCSRVSSWVGDPLEQLAAMQGGAAGDGQPACTYPSSTAAAALAPFGNQRVCCPSPCRWRDHGCGDSRGGAYR